MNPYTEYTLTHWEEPESTGRLVARDGIVSVTPEWFYEVLKSFEPVGYKEGEITLDIPVRSLLNYWKSLGGEYGVED